VKVIKSRSTAIEIYPETSSRTKKIGKEKKRGTRRKERSSQL